jgi:hypothetical protein
LTLDNEAAFVYTVISGGRDTMANLLTRWEIREEFGQVFPPEQTDGLMKMVDILWQLALEPATDLRELEQAKQAIEEALEPVFTPEQTACLLKSLDPLWQTKIERITATRELEQVVRAMTEVEEEDDRSGSH